MYFLLSICFIYAYETFLFSMIAFLENYQFDIYRLTWKNVALSANNILQRHSLNNFRAFVCSPMARVRRTQICRGRKSCRRQIVRNPRRERKRKREIVHVPYSSIPRYRLPVLKTNARDLPSTSHRHRHLPGLISSGLGPVWSRPTMDRPSRAFTAAGYRLDGARVARDSAFWPARYLDRNKFTLNYLLCYGPGRSFNTSHPRPSPSMSPLYAKHPRSNFGYSIRFVVGADFNFLILRYFPRHSFLFPPS